MRTSTCLACKYGQRDRTLAEIAALAELIGPDIHHHHHVKCEACGARWFDDVIFSPSLGVPIPSRRDTLMCSCPEDGRKIYTPQILIIRLPEAECRCDVGMLDGAGVAL